MAYSEEILSKARARLEQAKQEHEETYQARLQEAYARFPRLKEIDHELRGTMAQVVAAAFRKGEDPTAAIAAIKERNLALQQEREWILEASDLGGDFLDDSPICSKCGGTGYIGSTMCECLSALCRSEQKKALSSLIGTGKERFSAFRLDYYSTRPDPSIGISPRDIMTDTFQHCKDYAAGFSAQSASLLFTGGTGLGKTFLSGCIARAVAEKGFSVIYDTAIQIISDYENVRFSDNSEESRRSLNKYTSCDLLIIDDLGTEMVTQFTISALYQVINTRLIQGKQTIVSTNLDPHGIRTRYSPQIASRLLGEFELISFLGEDIRLRGKL